MGRGARGPAPDDLRSTGRMLRGDVRTALLSALSDRPMNGYQLMQELAGRSGGRWRVSPGSVYPTLRRLRDDGLIRFQPAGGRQGTLEVTDAGRREMAARREEVDAFWARVAEQADTPPNLRDAIGHVVAAAEQVARHGTRGQVERASQVLADAIRALYRILADGEEPT